MLFWHRAHGWLHPAEASGGGVIRLVGCLSVCLAWPTTTHSVSAFKDRSVEKSSSFSTLQSLHHWSIMCVVLCECAALPYWEYTQTHTHTVDFYSFCSLKGTVQKEMLSSRQSLSPSMGCVLENPAQRESPPINKDFVIYSPSLGSKTFDDSLLCGTQKIF